MLWRMSEEDMRTCHMLTRTVCHAVGKPEGPYSRRRDRSVGERLEDGNRLELCSGVGMNDMGRMQQDRAQRGKGRTRQGRDAQRRRRRAEAGGRLPADVQQNSASTKSCLRSSCNIDVCEKDVRRPAVPAQCL